MAVSQLLLCLLAPLLLIAQSPRKVMTLVQGHGLDRHPHGYAAGASPGQGDQTAIGLESMWIFDDSTINDVQGSNNLTAPGNIVLGEGKFGLAPVFVGTNRLEREFAGSTLQLGSAFTYAFWFKITATDGDFLFLSHGQTVTMVASGAAGSYGFAGNFTDQDYTTYDFNPETLFAYNEWHFFALGFDTNAGAIVMLDDQITTWPVQVGFQTIGAPLAAFEIGADSDGSRGLIGLMDEIGMWKRRLSINDLLFLYNGGAGRRFPWDSGRLLTIAQPGEQHFKDTWFYGPDGKYIVPR